MNQGKWAKHNCLLRNLALAAHLPATCIYSEHSLLAMLDKYQKIILKPNYGSCGKGIMLVSRRKSGGYRVQFRDRTRLFFSRRTMIHFVRSRIGRSLYLIQKFIPLLKVRGRSIDLRIMVQRRKDQPWVVTGMLVKLAKRGYKITNPEERVLSVDSALRTTRLRHIYPAIIRRLRVISIGIAKQLTRKYPHLRVIGVDALIDPRGEVWIIEANFSPMVSWFADLPDKRSYRRILSYRNEIRFQQRWLR